MCLLARDTATDGLYHSLEEQWYALDDITGKDFLFMFTGKYHEGNQRSQIWHKVSHGGDYALCNEYMHILNPEPSLSLRVPYSFHGREERGRFTPNMPKNHTRSVSALRQLFGLSEGVIPCLVFTNLYNGNNIVVSFSSNSDIKLYDYFRKLYIALEDILVQINAPNNSLALNTLYKKADETIRQSVAYASEPPPTDNTSVDMHQEGSNSIQIGVVADGGVVNLVDCSWRSIILRKTFDELDDFFAVATSLIDAKQDDRNTYLLPNKTDEIMRFYQRHKTDLEFLADRFMDLDRISEEYSKALHPLVYGRYSKDTIEPAVIDKLYSAINGCLSAYEGVLTQMLHQIRERLV